MSAAPGAVVSLVVDRGGMRRIGSAPATSSSVLVPIDGGEALVPNEAVNALQKLGADESPASNDGPRVQLSVGRFDAAQVLTQPRACSRGVILGGLRPGTEVQVLKGGTVIGTGISYDGTAEVRIPDGVPPSTPGGSLVARQIVCPKPPPPGGATVWIHDSPLPEALPLPFQPGQQMPAPVVASGLTACSRALHIAQIVPGAEVVVEAADHRWWASLNPSDRVEAWLALPVELTEGEKLQIRQEVARRCEVTSKVSELVVGPAVALAKPTLADIHCPVVPTLWAIGLVPQSDVEFSVTSNGAETIHRTVADDDTGLLRAPPMPVDSSVKVRQGHCNQWSPWSDPKVAHAMNEPFTVPKIPFEIFSCQDVLRVENVWPLVGILRVLSNQHGELLSTPVTGDIMTVSIAPSFSFPDDVWVEHEACGQKQSSGRRTVKQAGDVTGGRLDSPVYDGDQTVVLRGAVAGARIELWEATKPAMLAAIRAPLSDSGRVDVAIGGFGRLTGGWQLYARTLHCGQFPRTSPNLTVAVRAPVLTTLNPSSVEKGHPALTLVLKGEHFRSGASVLWDGASHPTTFVSETELKASITAADLATARSVQVKVRNPDGQTSNTLNFGVHAPPPPAPTGYDEVRIINCNTNFIPNSNIHREVHIYFRLAGMNPPDAWVPINDSPHAADYDAGGHCPAGPGSGASLALDDGVDYEVVVVDSYLAGCNGDPDQAACRRMAPFTVRGKTGGGTLTKIVN